MIKTIIYFLTISVISFSIAQLSMVVQAQKRNTEELFIAAAKTAEQVYDLRDRINVMNQPDVQIVTVTAYAPISNHCDSDPTITASMQPTMAGSVAVSRDLFKSGWVFGKKVYIEGEGVFKILDLMDAKHKNRIDILLPSPKDVKGFGIKKGRTAALLRI